MKKDKVTHTTWNILQELGVPGAEEVAAKIFLAVQINKAVESRKLTQAAAGKILSLPQSKVSLIHNYKVNGFSLEKLMSLLNALSRDIEIIVHSRPKLRRKGRITMLAA
jgi:predicted XRE-type DNA-binding protein